MKTLTRSEQRLAWLESLTRPLTEYEQAELYRCLHAIYCRERRAALAAQDETHIPLREVAREEARALRKMEAEAKPKVIPAEPPQPVYVCTFERQMEALQNGARLIPNDRIFGAAGSFA